MKVRVSTAWGVEACWRVLFLRGCAPLHSSGGLYNPTKSSPGLYKSSPGHRSCVFNKNVRPATKSRQWLRLPP